MDVRGVNGRLAHIAWSTAPRAVRYLNILRKKPSVIPRMARQMVEAKLLGRGVLRGVEMAVTYRCQASCPKCSCQKLVVPGREELSTDAVVELCRRVVEAGGILVNFTGGEPLLRPDLVELVERVGRMPCLVSITTNGVLADRASLDRLRRAGLDILQVSLSSPVPEEHDRETGIVGSFARALEAIGAARALGIEVLINTVITREVLGSGRLEAIAGIAVRNTSFLSLVFPAAVGGWQGQDVRLSQGDYDRLRRSWLPRGYVTTDTETSYHRGFCPAGSEKIYVTPYGDLFACPFIQKSEGSVLDEDIVALWRRMASHERPGCCNVAGLRGGDAPRPAR
jgi:MoaA/NifB/PqqE/SkfB family radical SAM enzyme